MPSLELLIAQILAILVAARLIGWLFRKIHQPRVIGEMVAGILLGPSLLGWVAPNLHGILFPPASLGHLSSLSYVGLLVFMFLVGLELDLRQLRKLGRAAVITSQVSIILPFAFGSLVAISLYPRLSDQNVSIIGFVLFMGAAMSVTAFPVLARILTEHNMLRTRVGSVAITCAAVDDVTAWCILAGIIVIVRSSTSALPLWLMLTGLGAFVLLMLFVVRLLLRGLTMPLENPPGSDRGHDRDSFPTYPDVGLDNREPGSSRVVWSIPRGSRDASPYKIVRRALAKTRGCGSGAVASPLFCAHGSAFEHLPDIRCQHVVLRGGDRRSGSRGQVGRFDDCGSNEWDDLAGVRGCRSADEHTRAC